MTRHTLLKAGLTVTALGAALGVPGGAAHAVVQPPQLPQLPKTDPQAALGATMGAVPHVTGVAKNLKVNPLAQTGVDPLNNGLGTQVSDFRPVDTTMLTGSVTSAPNLPVAGPLLGGVIPG
ncbi:hypothetical protein E2C00_26935 [Streptomyces sp. WAC05374]|uniref:hypothetical protein n=1 Tax=Streptomyces sp. WAC05374 TaxID=2487420 RepID=UPI000F880E7E|nr:hypothetical protein [Streptomyces sp. WAC05374]RST09097.1 hypothetical protein EF905_30185 [Streptomyces sp. WAC05374]TDF43163.1 hypothetical protein E2B92_19790 [Streptomyces sp. WAC05374]TDF50949.1 hypothetical protein E2C00_26935 [Streptomyces sp. WAC05374]TDF52308.1 hypothetical protein E2C02_22230 [Streptomyces sp. WAC05374]